MNKPEYYRQKGYQQGFEDGRRSGGRINEKYLDRLFRTETRNLPQDAILQYKRGWDAGFTEAIADTLKKAVLKEHFDITFLEEL